MANFNIDYLVVGGGGGGGSANGASGSGGGAGEYLYKTGQTLSTGIVYTYYVSVGANGVGGATTGNNGYGAAGTQGASSSFNNDSAVGGGFGVSPYVQVNGGDGGSGGGANYPTYSPGSSTAVYPGLGNSGGAGNTVNGGAGAYGSGGGGGAAQAGFPGTTSVAGNGGDGIYNSITGTSTAYAAGGGGGIFAPSGQYTFGIGGSGGTGGSSSITNNASDGAPSTGSGGGGGSYATSANPYQPFNGGNGASGIVILRWLTTDAGYTVSGSNPTQTIDGAYTVLSFTATVTSTITFTSIARTKVSSALVDFNSGTEDGLKLPSGDDANQPTGVQGMIRNNIDSGMTFYNGTEWISLDATTPPLSTVTLTNSWRAWDTASFVNGNNSCTDVTGGLVLGPYSSGSPGAFFYGSFNNVAGNKYWVMNGGGSHGRRAGFTRPTEFSVSYWGNKPNNPGFNSERGIWSFNALGTNCIRLARRNDTNTQSLRIYSGNSVIATFADGINLNTWYNITLTFSANTVKTYVGVQGGSATTLVNETTIGGTFPTGVSNNSGGTGFWIGCAPDYTGMTTDSWSGLNIYDGVARQAEIDTIVSNGYQQ